jgi:hypothetical protein
MAANEQSGKPVVDAAMYKRVLESHHEGALILEDLINRFGGNPYVRGDTAAARETDYRAGRLSVVSFMLGRINQANGVADPAAED